MEVKLHRYGLAFDRQASLILGQFEEVLKTNPLGMAPVVWIAGVGEISPAT